MSGDGPSGVYVVIPAYNEEKVIARTIGSVLQLGYTVVVVDDCSGDGTWRALDLLPVFKLHHPINLGQGAALQTGTDFCLRQGAKYVVHFDADGQHDPGQIADLLEPIRAGTADVVFGSRFLRASDRELVPAKKRLALGAARVLSGVLTRVWLSDAHNGFRALSRKAAEQICLRQNAYAHATEILDEVRSAGLRYVEVPTTVRYTDYSLAKGQPMSNGVGIFFDLLLRKLFK